MPSKVPQPPPLEARHSIAVVSRRTGVSQLLLRAWERRYGAVIPARTGTGRRMYTDADLEKISLLHLLTGAGHRIGDIANLARTDLRTLASELPPSVAAPTKVESGPRNADQYLAEALQATGDLDSHGLEQVLERALLDLSKPLLRSQLLVPLLEEIGERWGDGRMRVAHEHMASAIVASFLISQNSRQAVPAGAPLMAVATPSGQQHELGALLAASEALEAGWQVLYLGRDLPAEDIAAAVQGKGARAVIISLVFPTGDAGVMNELRRLRQLLGPDLAVVVGGRGAMSYAGVLAEISARVVTGEDTLRAVLSSI